MLNSRKNSQLTNEMNRMTSDEKTFEEENFNTNCMPLCSNDHHISRQNNIDIIDENTEIEDMSRDKQY